MGGDTKQSEGKSAGPAPGRPLPASGPYRSPAQRIARVVFWAGISLPVLLLLVLPGTVLWSFMDDYRGGRELEAALAEAKREGVPTESTDPYFQDWGSEGWGKENGAVYYQQVFSALPASRADRRRQQLPIVGTGARPRTPAEALPEDVLTLMRAYNADYSEMFDLLHKGAGAAFARHPIQWDGANTLMPHLTYSRESARRLVLKMWVDAEDAPASEATQDAIDALAIARPLVEEPAIVSSLVASAIQTIVARDGVERVLARSSPSNDDLARLQKAFSAATESLNARTALRGEVAMQRDLFARVAKGEDLSWFAGGQPEDKSASAEFERRLRRWMSRGQAKRGEARIIRLLLALSKESENPSPDVLSKKRVDADVATLEEAYRSLAYTQDRSGVDIAKIIVTTEKTRARLRSAAACIAAMRYKNDSGKWPESLGALVPKYLDVVPIDAFTGRPLVYKFADGGVMVYSVGQNLADDEGKPFLTVKPDGMSDEEWNAFDDSGFRIWR